MAKRLPASMRTREELSALIEGRLASPAGRSALVELATRLIVEEAVLQSWYAAPRTTPGGQPIYADGTIEMILTLGMVYHLPLRQTEGLARSVLSLMDLSLPVPRHSTLSRRRKTLDIQPIKSSARGPIDIVFDGNGLKIFGAGEWCRAARSWPTS